MTVGVAMGGISSEHPVSLVSGSGMLGNLDRSRYAPFPILISRENTWIWPRETGNFDGRDFDAARARAYLENPPEGWVTARFPLFASFPFCDLLLIGLHGVGGEDGRLQGFLEMAGQPYTGSRSRGSALAMDKVTSKQIYLQNGIPTARFRVVEKPDFGGVDLEAMEGALGYPLVVKDPLGGSSLGLGIAKNRDELKKLIRDIGAGAERLLFEEFLQGREGTCGHLDDFGPLPPTEIRPLQDGYFNFEAKYQPGRTEEVTPAGFPAAVLAEMQRLAGLCHRALQLSVYSRTDMIWTPDRGLLVLETNNLPGFTPTSLLPQAAAHAGLSYAALLDHLIATSLKRA